MGLGSETSTEDMTRAVLEGAFDYGTLLRH